MWIKVIDRTQAQKKAEKGKPIQLQLKFESVPIPIPNKKYSLPFTPEVQGSDPYIVSLLIDKPKLGDPKQLAMDIIDIVPLAFAEKIYVKIPDIYIVIAVLVIMALVIIGVVIGFTLRKVL